MTDIMKCFPPTALRQIEMEHHANVVVIAMTVLYSCVSGPFGISNYDLEQIRVPIPTQCQAHNNALTPVVKTAEGFFFLNCDYRRCAFAVGVFYHTILCPHSPSRATAWHTIQKSYQGKKRGKNEAVLCHHQ